MSAPNLTGARWRRSSFTDNGNGNCVEIALIGASTAIRDSKNRDGGTLVISGRQWASFRRTAARR
ncbi:DUF397 domain-containing protein [Actinokineospora sp.]|uniref:DUF397 domain-containing protein n=1 Tax=Actinokineospora sp. TaxID=1872133 RepID=UPI004037A91F